MRERERERERDLVRYNLLAFVMTRNSLFGMGVVVESPVIVRAGAVRTYVFVQYTHTHTGNQYYFQSILIYLFIGIGGRECRDRERERGEPNNIQY